MRVRYVGNREWKRKKREKGGLTVDLQTLEYELSITRINKDVTFLYHEVTAR